jgi:hypothetical protein
MYFYLFWVIYFKVIYSTKISPTYNFGGQQNPELDKIYNHLYGQNLYFYTTDNFLTVNLFPSLSLEITFKFYTSDVNIIDSLNENKYLYFGFNFNLSNSDSTKDKYTTDAFCCAMNQDDATCYDYVFDTSNNTYVRNNNEEVSNNEAIEVATNLFGSENVITERKPSLSGDDFAEYILCVPGTYSYIGTHNDEDEDTKLPHHNSKLVIDEESLIVGTSMYVGYTMNYLSK